MKKAAKLRLEAKTLVVDASVAKAAGERDDISSSALCRGFLVAVLEHGHRCAMDGELCAEWARRESAYAKGWRKTMVSRRRVVAVQVDQPQITPLINDLNMTQGPKRAMLKDRHLVEVALVTDHRIVSLDDKARKLFGKASEHIGLLQMIYWANPVREGERCIEWVQKGAPNERHRLLSPAVAE